MNTNTELLNGKFLKIRSLGEGGVGEVIEAAVTKNCEYASVGQRVAIKIYKPWVLNQPNQATRIERELRVGLQISSEHVVTTYELASDQDRLFLVMELLKGATLSQWIRDNPSPDFSSIEKICSDIAEGLHSIHRRGLIHRDIKPDNILITKRGAVIMDLGVIKDLNQASTITGGEFLGTIRYAAPEYLFGEPYDNKIDSYSFGAVLHELVLGKPVMDPELYWSKQIVEKNRYYFWDYSDSNFNINIYDRLGFRESRFLAAVVQGSLIKPNSRLTMVQIYLAFKNRIWEKPFLHWVDSKVVNEWPNIPSELEEKVSNFIERNDPRNLKSVGNYLYDAACSSFSHSVWCYEDDTEEAKILYQLFKQGLITEPMVNEQLELQGELTPLAWQLLLRGYFK